MKYNELVEEYAEAAIETNKIFYQTSLKVANSALK